MTLNNTGTNYMYWHRRWQVRSAATTAVVTVGFWPQDDTGITIALSELATLEIRRVILVHDCKKDGGTRALKALQAVASELDTASTVVELLSVDEDDTTPRWRRGILKAFEDSTTEATFVFPSDFATPPKPTARAGWR